MTKLLLSITLTTALIGCGGGDNNPAAADGVAPAEVPVDGDEAAAATPGDDIGEIIATVGTVQVGAKEFQMAAQRKTPANGEALSPEERQEILDGLVVEKILYSEAKKKNIDLDPKVQKVMINTLLRQDVYNNVRNSDFSQEELQAYFETHNDEFVVPEKVQIKRIFVKVNDRRPDADAKALVTDLRAQVMADPTKFKDLAAEHSEDPYRRRGGDLGFISKEGKPGIDPAVIDKAFTLDEGQVSEVFEAAGGYNIVLAAAKRERVERTFEQMKGSVLRKVKNERYKELYDDYVGQVRGDYAVEIDEGKLSTIEIRPTRRLSLGPGGAPAPEPKTDGPK